MRSRQSLSTNECGPILVGFHCSAGVKGAMTLPCHWFQAVICISFSALGDRDIQPVKTTCGTYPQTFTSKTNGGKK